MEKNELLRLINDEEIACTNEQVDLLFIFMDKTLEANEKFNLTAIKDKDQFIEKMLFDSSLVGKYTKSLGERINCRWASFSTRLRFFR